MYVVIKSLLVLVFCIGYLTAQDIVVQIPDGKLKGRIETTASSTAFYSFLGIRYGQPPVGKLRFQAPVPVEPWDDVYDATSDKNVCYQVTSNRDDENEDCLFINVYTPRDTSDTPVMVWMYGGAFLEGASEYSNWGPKHFIDHGVILVTFNYRLGPFGFASTGDSAIPGNAGLKDQNLALQWVQKNIQYFGGDPSKVTIFGESAGSASVTYQVLSPKSKGLFRAAIAESGSFLSSWAFQRDQKAITYETASYLNPAFANGQGTTQELLAFLQSVPAADLDSASLKKSQTESTHYLQIQQGFFWAPVIEHQHDGAFVTKGMYESLKNGEINQVPLLIGFNSEEALFFADDQSGLNYNAGVFDKETELLAPLDMHITNTNSKSQAGQEIKNIYVPNSSLQSNLDAFVTYFSDQCFVRSIIKHAELQSAFTDVYLYEFAYSGPIGRSVSQPVEGFSNTVRHAEEINYLFSRNWGSYDTTDLSKWPQSDQTVVHRFVTLFTNFAKTLNPTPQPDPLLENIIWPKVDLASFPYLIIGSYSEIRNHPKQSALKAWDDVYDKYGVPPYDTY